MEVKIKNRKEWLILILFMLITFILILRHEIWNDEAQAWLIAKDLSFIDIIKQMKYEGHPCLWHFILAIPAKLGLPVLSMNIISWLFVSISVYIILFHAKWNIFTKIFALFNPTLLFFLPVTARCYSLILFLLCLFVILYSKRQNHPVIYTFILCLLANTHIIMCAFVGIVSCFFLIECIKNKIEKKQLIKILMIFLLGFLFVCISLIPSFTNCQFVTKDLTINKMKSVWVGIGNYFFNEYKFYRSDLLIFFTLFINAIILYFHDKKISIFFVVEIVFFIFIHMLWPFTVYERTCMLFVFILLFNLKNCKKACQFLIIFLSIATSISTSDYIIFDFQGEYSTSKNMGTWINDNVENNSLLVFLNSERHTSAVAYIKNNKKLTYYNMRLHSYQTYITWIDTPPLEYEEVLKEMKMFSSQYNEIYVMVSTWDFMYLGDTQYLLDRLLIDKIITLEYETTRDFRSAEYSTLYKVNKIAFE